MSVFKSFKEKKLVIVLNSFVFYGGATKSIFNYYRFNLNKEEKVEILDLQTYRGIIKFVLSAFLSPRIVVNGLSAMDSWLVLLVCYFRRHIIFYCHEAEHAFEAHKKRAPLKYKLLAKVFPNLFLVCVSKWQCNYICSAFTVNKSAIAYESIDLDFTNRLDASKTNIIMLGYRMERKGVDLFSKVADLAKEKAPHLKFNWIGSGNATGLYTSDNVAWLGELMRPEVVIQQSDLLFLSSVDDPFPLACLEAIAYKKRCVVYKNTGTAEVIRSVSGCAVYDTYSPEAAFNAIQKALDEKLDSDQLEKIHNTISSVESFAARFDALIQEAHTAPTVS